MASSGHTSQSTTHDMGRPSGKTRPQAQARRSTLQIPAPELSAEPGKIQSPEKRKNKKTRSAQRRAETAAIGEGTDSDFATLTPEMDTVEVPTSDNEPREKNRKRNRGSAPVAEEEGAVPAHEPRRRHRSQSSESPEETTYHGPQNQTEHDDAPTAPSNDVGGQRSRARISKHQRTHLDAANARNHRNLRRKPFTSDRRTRPSTKTRRPRRATTRAWSGHVQRSRSTSAERKKPNFSGKRKLLLISERANNSGAGNEI